MILSRHETKAFPLCEFPVRGQGAFAVNDCYDDDSESKPFTPMQAMTATPTSMPCATPQAGQAAQRMHAYATHSLPISLGQHRCTDAAHALATYSSLVTVRPRKVPLVMRPSWFLFRYLHTHQLLIS